MILEIYITLTCIAIVLLIFGYYFDGILFKLLGYSFLFIINIIPLFGGGIEYHSGDTVTEISPTVTTIVKDYSLFDSFYFFFLLTIIGSLGVLFIAAETPQAKKFMEDDDD